MGMSFDQARERLIFALDYPTLDEARRGAAAVAPAIGVLKVGLELFIREGAAAVGLGRDLDREVFLDLKLCDIPETVERAIHVVGALGVRYVTVHAAGGRAMLEAAVRAAAEAPSPLTVLAVTVLTSLDDADLQSLGVDATTSAQATRLAELAWGVGVRGFVCSASEVGALRGRLGEGGLYVTPGIRPAGAERGDQKRVATPASAIADGASLLVVGRPIRDAAEPLACARTIVQQIAEAKVEQ